MSGEQAAHSKLVTDVQAPEAVPKTGWGKRILKAIGLFLVVLILMGVVVELTFGWMPGHSKPSAPPVAVARTDDPIQDAINKGVEFLKVHQEPDGAFSKGVLAPKPAFTALVVEALARGKGGFREETHPFMKEAVAAILACQREDGAIVGDVGNAFNLSNYVTSISVMALTALENPAHKDVIDRARAYLLSLQQPMDAEGFNGGGVGYGKGGTPDGNNTAMWVEALTAAGVEKDSPAFKNAEKFFSRLQNNPETNDVKVEGYEVGTDGGFIYGPGRGNDDIPDEVNRQTGARIPRSYGLMSYAALKSFLIMDVDKSDPRVQSAWRWVKDNYTLEENKNIGKKGLFYYYMTMAKALDAYGERIVETGDGEKHDWAKELSQKMIDYQWDDGRWVNKWSSGWMEDDPVLVTAYALRTLTICQRFLAEHPLPVPPAASAPGMGAPEAQ